MGMMHDDRHPRIGLIHGGPGIKRIARSVILAVRIGIELCAIAGIADHGLRQCRTGEGRCKESCEEAAPNSENLVISHLQDEGETPRPSVCSIATAELTSL